MSILLDIVVNLLAALIGFALGWIWQRLTLAIKLRKAKRFWKTFADGELQLVLGRFSEFSPFEQSGFLGVGPAMGLMELRAYFENLGLQQFKVSFSDRVIGDALKNNLILVDGPDANHLTKEAMDKIATTLRFGDPTKYEIALYDTTAKSIFAPPRNSTSSGITKDYALVVKTSNPFSPGKQILIIGGSFGYGTWAGIRFVTSKSFVEHPLIASGSPIECLIETDIVRETPQDIRMITIRALSVPSVQKEPEAG